MNRAVCITSVLRRYCVGIFTVLALSGCDTEVVGPQGGLLRNPTAPLGGSSRFDTASFQGAWQTVSCIGTCASSETYRLARDGVFIRTADGVLAPYAVTAPGVLRVGDTDRTLVVMWIDEGIRTAAIGDADGRWAAVIDRTAASSPDRLKAATEILDFYGWDTAKMKAVN